MTTLKMAELALTYLNELDELLASRGLRDKHKSALPYEIMRDTATIRRMIERHADVLTDMDVADLRRCVDLAKRTKPQGRLSL